MSDNLKILIPCCDESLPIIRINSYLFNKFYPEAEVHYLGFSSPSFNFYNENHHFHSIAPQQEGGSSKWTRYIHDFLSNIDDKHIIFMIDDYWLCDFPNFDMLELAKKTISDNEKVGRFDLTFDSQVEGNLHNVKDVRNNQICVKHPKAPYRVSTQPAIWNVEYLLELMDNDWSPWQFEIMGTELASNKYIKSNLTFCFSDKDMVDYPLRTVAKGAVSRYNPEKYNVLGFKSETIKELVNEGFFTEEELIWGQWNGIVPSFYDLYGYNFDPKMMPLHAASLTNWKEYESMYNSDVLVVNLFDFSFAHTEKLWGYIASNGTDIWGKPKNMHYIKRRREYNGVSLFVDDMIFDSNLISSVKSKYKVGWIIEPRDVKEAPYHGVDKNHEMFDLIITFDKELIEKYDNCKHLVWCESRVRDEEWGKWDESKKSKLVSMIASNKTMTPGHRFRFDIAEALHKKHNFDLWGNAFNTFEEKTEPLGGYFFSIVANNSLQDNFFTEALCDCFALKTIPIFRGCENIGNFFNEDGIITFNSIEELDAILENLTIEDYHKRKDAIEDNYQISNKFRKSVDEQISELISENLIL